MSAAAAGLSLSRSISNPDGCSSSKPVHTMTLSWPEQTARAQRSPRSREQLKKKLDRLELHPQISRDIGFGNQFLGGSSRAKSRGSSLLACEEREICAPPSKKVMLNYQEPPPPGKINGRYINQADKGDAVDLAKLYEVDMHDARQLASPPSLETMGFGLERWPSKVQNFRDDAEVKKIYYEEIRQVVKKTSGASRVFVFDHTIRQSGNTNLNTAAGGSAAPVPRVHCDYTAEGAPRRLEQLGKEGIYSLLKGRDLTQQEVEALAAGRFAFINVWRSISEEPIQRMPLACCDEKTVKEEERFLYLLMFPNRTGENYSLKYADQHKWYYYPRQTKDEVLVFKVFDKATDGVRFVFHTAFEEPNTPADAPARVSIEVRTIAFFV